MLQYSGGLAYIWPKLKVMASPIIIERDDAIPNIDIDLRFRNIGFELPSNKLNQCVKRVRTRRYEHLSRSEECYFLKDVFWYSADDLSLWTDMTLKVVFILGVSGRWIWNFSQRMSNKIYPTTTAALRYSPHQTVTKREYQIIYCFYYLADKYKFNLTYLI